MSRVFLSHTPTMRWYTNAYVRTYTDNLNWPHISYMDGGTVMFYIDVTIDANKSTSYIHFYTYLYISHTYIPDTT